MEVLGQRRHVGEVAHALDEQAGGQQQADPHRQHHVEQHCQHQAGEQDHHIVARCDAQGVRHMPGLAHVPGHHQQQCRQGRHRQVAEQRGEQQHGQQHHAGVNDGGDGRTGAGAYVGGTAGNGCGGGDAAEQRSDQVAQALPEQFGIGIVPGASHAVGHYSAEQRLDGAEHGDGEGRCQQLAEQLERQAQGLPIRPRQLPGPGEGGQEGRDAGMADAVDHIAEALAQGRHGQAQHLQQQAEQCTEGQRHQVPRNLGYKTWPDHQHREGGNGHHGISQVRGRQCLGQQVQLVHVILRSLGQRQAEQILDLQRGDDDTDTGGEAERHRIGDELDQPPQPRESHGDEDQPGHHRADQQAAEAELLGDGQQDHHEGCRGAGDVEARAAGEGDQRCRQQYRVEAVLRGYADGDGQRHGQGDGNDAYGNAGGQVAAQVRQAVALAQGLAHGGENRGEV
ncbi:hypothetical protein D9M68_456480 [compost metagenome]